MLKAAVLTGLVLAWTLPSATFAQDFEYGSTSELAGVIWIYVYTGAEIEVRENILRTIQKGLSHIQVTQTPEEADVVLVYGSSAYTQYCGTYSTASWKGNAYSYGSGATANASASSSSVPMYRAVVDGQGWILGWSESGRARILSKYSDSRSIVFERRPSTNFARHFVKEYVKANPTRPAARAPRNMANTQRPASNLTPEQTLFAEKARGVIERTADDLRLDGEWRAVLLRRALPHLQNLMIIDARAGNAEIGDTIRGAAGDVAKLNALSELRLRPYEAEVLNAIRSSCSDTTGFRAMYSNAMAVFAETNPSLSPDDVNQFVNWLKEGMPSALAEAVQE